MTLVYPTLYEGEEERITRGPDIPARSYADALDTVKAMVSTGQLPASVQVLDMERAGENDL